MSRSRELSSGRRVWVAFFDIDALIYLNHDLGHLTGDNVILAVAVLLRHRDRTGEMKAYRFGGDEFLCVFQQDSGDEVALACRSILDGFAHQLFPARHPERLGEAMTLSAAVGEIRAPGRAAFHDLLRALDDALEERRQLGESFGVLVRV